MAEQDNTPPYNIPTMGSMMQPQQGKPQYILQAPLMQAIDWLLSNPSIPLSMRTQFYILWENVIFGNYDVRDRLFLMSKFREWCILLKWFIPEQQWGNLREFQGDTSGSDVLRTELNVLLNMLEQLYYIQLTRGKDGFTVKELTTMRSILRGEEEKTGQKKGVRLF
jgi:hypothetical protein